MSFKSFLHQFHLSRPGSLSVTELIDTVRRHVKGETSPMDDAVAVAESGDNLRDLPSGEEGGPRGGGSGGGIIPRPRPWSGSGRDASLVGKSKGDFVILELLGEGAFGKVCMGARCAWEQASHIVVA